MSDFFQRKFVGVNITNTTIEAVELIKSVKKISVSNLNQIEISPDIINNGKIENSRKLSRIIKDLFKEAKPRPIRPNRIIFSLPVMKTDEKLISEWHNFFEKLKIGEKIILVTGTGRLKKETASLPAKVAGINLSKRAVDLALKGLAGEWDKKGPVFSDEKIKLKKKTKLRIFISSVTIGQKFIIFFILIISVGLVSATYWYNNYRNQKYFTEPAPLVISEPLKESKLVSTTTPEKITPEIQTVIVSDTPTNWLNVRKGPGITYTKITKIYPGEEYELLNEKDGWYEIQIDKDTSGWISGEYAEKEE